MLDSLRGRASERRLRLFVCACCRRLWDALPPEGRAAVAVAERLADGLASEAERSAAYEAAGGDWAALYSQGDCAPAKALLTPLDHYYVSDAAACILSLPDQEGRYLLSVAPRRRRAEKLVQAGLLRDLFGNPFRRVVVGSAWLERGGGTVGKLAQAAYDNRILPAGTLEPARLGVLADALEEASCDNAEILSHLRGPGPHARGCWALDAILGKG